MNIRKSNKNNGITLIALIITIIVMLILVAVTIGMAINGGLFEKAGKATGDTKNAINEEQMLANGAIQIDGVWYDSIDDYLNGKPSQNQTEENKTIKISYDYDKTAGIKNTTVNLQFEIGGIPTFDEYVESKTNGELEELMIKGKYKGTFDEYLAENNVTRETFEQMVKQQTGASEYRDGLIIMSEQGWATVEYLVLLAGGAGMDSSGLEELFVKVYNYTGSFDDFLAENGSTREELEQIAQGIGLTYEDFLKSAVARKSNVTVTISNGTTLEVEYANLITYFGVNRNGTYTVSAVGVDGVKGETTIEITCLNEEKFSEIYQENTQISQGSYTAMIPKGFAVGISEGINTIEKGLVITDAVDSEGYSIGNEFVWIPVTYTVEGGSEKDANGLYPEFLEVFYRSPWDDNQRTNSLTATNCPSSSYSWSDYTEPYANGYTIPTSESTDYYEMMRSVQEHKGFYLGRYEAGSQDASGNPLARSEYSNGTSKMVVKRDQYPYTYVDWGLSMSDYTSDVIFRGRNQGKGALYLSKHMYDGQDIGATSTLCYGIQWDAMLDFIKEDVDVSNSTSWGNYADNLWTITSSFAKWKINPGDARPWNRVEWRKKRKNFDTRYLTNNRSK